LLSAGSAVALAQSNDVASPTSPSNAAASPSVPSTPTVPLTPTDQGNKPGDPKSDQNVSVPPTTGDGKIPATQIPGASAQTMPSTKSADNAEKDKHLTVDRGMTLDAAQRKQISQALASAKPDQPATTGIDANTAIEPKVAATLPSWVEPHALPADLAARMPYLNDLKYLKVGDKVVLVNSAIGYVVAVIDAS
jgi:hypothetical protein